MLVQHQQIFFSGNRSMAEIVTEADKQKFVALCVGFQDEEYRKRERDYKWSAHERWQELLNRPEFRQLLSDKRFKEIAD